MYIILNSFHYDTAIKIYQYNNDNIINYVCVFHLSNVVLDIFRNAILCGITWSKD
jgi:hypothetical protein